MWALRKIIPAALALLLVLMPVWAAEQEAGETQPDTSSVIDVGDADVDTSEEQPSEPEPEPDGSTVLDYVISINTYCTYLFGFAVVVFVFWACNLMYKFLNMFF